MRMEESMSTDTDPTQAPIRRSTTVIETRLPDELILLDPSSGEMYSLNQTGQFVWERLDEGLLDRIPAQLAETFDITVARAGADVRALVQELARAGLVEPAGDIDR